MSVHLSSDGGLSLLSSETQGRSKRTRDETGGHVSRMLLGLSLPPRAEARQALKTWCHIWEPRFLEAVMGVLLASCWKDPLTSSH